MVRREGFRFGLVLQDGEPAEPGMFVTVGPTWHVGGEFLASSLQRFRIVAIDPTMDPDEARATFHAVWVVEPIDA
jgi:hypothetical protein